MLNPRIRARRLQAEYKRVCELHNSGGLIAIEKTLGSPPDRYWIRFTCRGIARVLGDRPFYSELHRVYLALASTYPTEQPLMEWLTPIFHPNIRENGQEVCIGAWYPAKTLDKLLFELGELIQYKNYASHDPIHLEASLWVMAHKELFPVDERSLLGPSQPVQSKISRQAEAGETDEDITILG